jgi:hypothetical protein
VKWKGPAQQKVEISQQMGENTISYMNKREQNQASSPKMVDFIK